MATNFGLSADWADASVRAPDYASAIGGMAGVFAQLGQQLAIVSQGNQRMELDRQKIMLEQRKLYHQETMDLMDFNLRASEERHKQSLQAIQNGIMMQKQQYELEELQRNAETAFGVAELRKKIPNYLSKFATAKNDLLGMYELQSALENEPYIMEDEQSRLLYTSVNEAIERTPYDGPEGETIATALQKLQSGDFDTLREAVSKAKDPNSIATAVGLAKKTLPNVSDAALTSMLKRPVKPVSPEQYKAMQQAETALLADHYQDIAKNRDLYAMDPIALAEKKESLQLALNTLRQSTLDPNQLVEGKGITGKDISAELDAVKSTMQTRASILQSLALRSTPADALVLDAVNQLGGNTSIVTPRGTILMSAATPIEKASYLATRYAAEGDPRGKVFSDFVDRQNAKRVTPEEFESMVKDIKAKNPGVTSEAVYESVREQLEGRLTELINKSKDPDTTAQAEAYLSGLRQTVLGSGIGQALAGPLGQATGAIAGQVRAIANQPVDPTKMTLRDNVSGTQQLGESVKQAWSFLAGKKYLSPADKLVSEHSALAKTIDTANDIYLTSMSRLIQKGNDPRISAEELNTALNDALDKQTAYISTLESYGLDKSIITPMEAYFEPAAWMQLNRRLQARIGRTLPSTQPDMREALRYTPLTPQQTSGMTNGSTGAVPTAPAGGAGQASWATGIRPTGASQQP